MASRKKKNSRKNNSRNQAVSRDDSAPSRAQPTWAGPMGLGAATHSISTSRDDHGLRLATLSTLPEVSLDSMPDVRSWPVELADGTTIGKVTRIIVDQTQDFVPRYLDVTVNQDVLVGRSVPSHDLLIPIGCARLSTEGNTVVIHALDRSAFDSVPLLAPGAIGLDHERMVARAFGLSSPVFDADTLYATEAFSLTDFLASRRDVTV